MGGNEEHDMIDHEETQEPISLAEIIPVQNSDPVAVRIQSSGEYRLLWAILEDAIDCYFRYADMPTMTRKSNSVKRKSGSSHKRKNGCAASTAFAASFRLIRAISVAACENGLPPSVLDASRLR